MLKVRDAAAAEKIAALLLERPGLKVCALYGELHLGKAHIPAKLKDLLGRKSKVLVVHQNEPILYWKAPRLKEGQRAEVVKLRSDEFCVLNSVPWMKVRSYLDWIEGSLEEECSDGADLASSVEGYARLLQETLEIEPFGMSSLEILGAQSLDSGYAGKGLSKEERALRKHSLKFHRTTFLPLQRALLLPSTSTNALTEAGAIALWAEHSKKSPQKAAISGPRLTAQFLIGYLGSKILNPKRKCNEVKDMKNFLARRSPAGAYEKEKRKVIQRALWLLSAYIKPSPHGSVGPLPEILEIEATRLAGYVLGNRLFLALLKDASLLPSVRRIFTSSAATEEWAKHLLQEASRNIWEANPSPKAKSEAY